MRGMSGREIISVYTNSASDPCPLEESFPLDKTFQEYSYVLQPIIAEVSSVEVFLNFSNEPGREGDGMEPCAVVQRVVFCFVFWE